MEKLRTKTTFINERFHIVLLEDDMVINEIACKLKIDVGWCCKYMLRWYDKLNDKSKMVISSRQNSVVKNVGKIWYEKDLRHE